MSDVLRSLSSTYRSALGRIGPLGSQRRSPDDRLPASAPRGRLFRKYVLLIVGLVSLVLLLNSALDFWFGYDENKAALFRIQQEKAGSAARRIEQFVDEIERQLGWTTAPQWAVSPLEQRRFDYVRLLRQVPAITELIQLDDTGKEQLKVSRLAIDVVGSEKDYSQSPSFTEARQHRVWFSPVYFRKESEPYMTVSLARAGRNAGVTVAEVNLKLIWDVITGLKIGQGGYAYVVDRDGRLIAHPDISLVLRNTDLAALPQVAAAHAEASGEKAASPGAMVAKGINGNSVLTAHAAIAPLGWIVFVELPLNEALAPLYGLMLRTAGLLALALVLATLAALLLARRMTVPIRALQTGAARIGAGELDRQIDIRTGDELEDLAGDFNRMASDLQKSYANLEKKVEDRTAELKEALDQQTATAEVLGVINGSPGDLTPVFNAILEKAHSLCGAEYGVLLDYDGERFRPAAVHGASQAVPERLRVAFRPGFGFGGLVRGERLLHIHDMAEVAAQRPDDPLPRALVENSGIRTQLAIPLRKDGRLLGIITANRREVHPFSDKEIALLENFAAQAVIAMENARLITETREALDQQTATAEVLGIINSSPGDLAPVFDAMLEKAMRLCEAAFGQLAIHDGERFRTAATRGVPSDFAEYRKNNPPIYGPGTTPARLLTGERVICSDDLKAEPAYLSGEPNRRALVDLGGARSAAIVALTKEERVLGFIQIYRQEVRPFSDKQTALLENFAAQAVIAMENARLLTETREALEQQTATAEVLQVINSSRGDLAPVFDAILEKAHGLCGITLGELELNEDGKFHAVAMRGVSGPFAELLRQPFAPPPESPPARLLAGEPIVQIADLSELAKQRPHDPRAQGGAQYGLRTVLFVPLRKDDALLGYITAYRQEVWPFSEKEIALLQNFAAQAVIAMENTRLITETREALDQQTATAEVLGVINSSPGDLAPVFESMLEKATRLCEAPFGILRTWDGERFHFGAVHGDAHFSDWVRQRGPIRTDSDASLLGRIQAGERVVRISDAQDDEAYRVSSGFREMAAASGIRSAVTVALHKDDSLLGIITVYRQEVRPFSEKEIALLQNFAAQAVIAIENARLITETREALDQQTATAEVLGVINSSPGDLTPVFDAMLEKAMRLCGAAFGVLAMYDEEHYRVVATHGVPLGLAEFVTQAVRVHPGSMPDRLRRGEDTIQVPDIAALGSELRTPGLVAMIELGNARTAVWVALRKDGVAQGFFGIYRQEVRPFTDKQIALLQNFTAQAVIAIENARLLTETREALEQQTATAEVLQVINSSPGELQPVFDILLDKAMRLCGAAFGVMLVIEGGEGRTVAAQGLPPVLAEWRRDHPVVSPHGTLLMRVLDGEPYVHTPDLKDDDLYRRGEPLRRANVDLGGARTSLYVPLTRHRDVLGTIHIYRQEVRPFTDKQIALLQNFAAQAVIAMENARLITETREALEQQTATAEVLGVINSSPGDLAPVFDAMLEKAARLCEAPFGILRTWDGERFHFGAVHGDPRFSDWVRRRHPIQPDPDNSPLGRILLGEQIVHVADVSSDESSRTSTGFREMITESGLRSSIMVALRKEDILLGTITVYRQEVRPFSDKQIALLQNFAAQAVIAMENARLITETREALEQQTATAEVLQVINSSPGDLAPVFDAILDKAHSLCGAEHGMLFTYDGERFWPVASANDAPARFGELMRGGFRPDPGNPFASVIEGEPVVHVADIRRVSAQHPEDAGLRVAVENGLRTFLVVPLRKDDALLGAITANRLEVRPFTDKQIALLQNFAAQAVIAMENARLLTETRDALEQQTATAEVLQVINSSPGDLAPVFDAMLDKAMRLCEAAFGGLWVFAQDRYVAVALQNVPTAYAEFLADTTVVPGPGTAPYRFLQGERVVHNLDLSSEEAYTGGDLQRRALVDLGGARTALQVPLRKDDQVLGVITIYRQEARPFSDKQIALLQNFAAQAVIAMENARLITETREALEQQTATAEVLQVINSSPGELTPVFDAMLEKALHLCEAAFGLLHSYDGKRFRALAIGGMSGAAAEPLCEWVADPGSALERIVLGDLVVHIPDVVDTEAYRSGVASRLKLVELTGSRTALWVALRKDDALLGVFVIYRREVRPFSDKQIAVVENFAAQAVIAMENARLITELRESLEYQTATSDVLKVISRSTGELQPVLQTLTETAARLCGADKALILRRNGDVYGAPVVVGFALEYKTFLEVHPISAGRGTLTGRVALECRPVHIADVASDPEYTLTEAMTLGKARTMLGVPLLREGSPIGVISLVRERVEPFTEKQIALVTTFADQAVIAIENARLFDELRARTTELGSSVAELKMLNEVAQAVSSTLDLRTVLSTVLNASLGVTWANAGAVFRYSRAERAFRLVEAVGWDEALTGSVQELRIVETESAMGEAVVRRAPIQLPDLAQRPSYPLRDFTLAAGFHSALIVPLLGAERTLGAIILMRQEAGEFPTETVRLMQTLASQSVLAIQNARLFREIADKSEQLALASQHKSQFLANMSHELRTPLNAILGYAELLVDGIYGVLPDRPKGVLERIQNNGKHLLALINDVLDLAKIEAGQLILTLEDYSVPEVVKSVVTATEPLATSKGLKLTSVLQDDLPMAHGDARRVSQVLLNLVGNAIKFTDKGEVEIRAVADKGQFVLTVRDTGPGIADADQERIFGEFQQIDNSNTRKKGGTGLGLAISKRMVEMQGGAISVDSGLGQGSTFRVVLPIHVDEMMEAA